MVSKTLSQGLSVSVKQGPGGCVCKQMLLGDPDAGGLGPHVCVCVVSRSVMSDFTTPGTVACQAPLSMGILQATVLKRVTMPSSQGSSQPGV